MVQMSLWLKFFHPGRLVILTTLLWTAGGNAEQPLVKQNAITSERIPPAHAALRKAVRLNVREQSLVDVIARIEQQIGVPLTFDAEGLKAEGVHKQTPVTIDLAENHRAYEVLALVLEPLHLAYVCKDNEILIKSEQDGDATQLRDMVRREAVKLCVEGGDGDGLAEAILTGIEQNESNEPPCAGYRQETYERALDLILHLQELAEQ